MDRIVCALSLTLLVPVVGLGQGIPWDLAAPPVPTSAVYLNSAGGGQLGAPVQVGNYNGDGHLDMAIAAFTSSSKSRNRNGIVWVVPGDGTIGATIDMATFTGPRLAIHGVRAFSLLGVEMATGDLDGDGFDDLVMGSSHGVYFSEAPRAGEVVILYGRPEWGDTVRELDMAALPVEQRARFVVGERTRYSGNSPTGGDRLGSWLQLVDLDDNNLLDLVMGMDQSDGPAADRSVAGACAVLWDANEALGGGVRLRVGEEATSDTMTIIYGRDAGDMFGATHHSDDYDGDGRMDLAISAGVTRSGLGISELGYLGSGGGDGPENNLSQMGEVRILWGAQDLRSHRRIDTQDEIPVPTTILYGERAGDYFGEDLVSGEVNGDHIQDLLVGALGYDNGTLSLAGASFVFPGGPDLRAASEYSIFSPPLNYGITAFIGIERFGISGDTIEIADFNRDGIGDMIIGVPYGTPQGRYQAGYGTVVFGGQNFPTLPAKVPLGLTLGNGLMYGLIYGADSIGNRGDYLTYSSAIGDMDGDGVPDYLPNAMQGDGFQNAFDNAGEYYVLSGDMISRLAAAPSRPRLGTSTGVAGLWNAAQPIYGPVTGYKVVYTLNEIEAHVNVTGLEVLESDIPPGATLVSVASIMDGAVEEEISFPAIFPPFVGVGWQME